MNQSILGLTKVTFKTDLVYLKRITTMKVTKPLFLKNITKEMFCRSRQSHFS